MDLEAFKINDDAMLNGKWFPVEGTDAELLIASANSPRFKTEVIALLQDYQSKHGKMPKDGSEEFEAITREATGRQILLGWRKLRVKGKVIKYSPKKSAQIMHDYSLLYYFVKDRAENITNYQPEGVAKK